ncbi:uncharacterized protein M6B38_296600 [Iris pallida]|uniref:Uncharacterized protein n=1 Tax=Iris pallida TaxID=29817 RepID=A0AAX6HRU5_IRIPA|nr:uncharacterized protein M6B38_296600 [Iris pallida]
MFGDFRAFLVNFRCNQDLELYLLDGTLLCIYHDKFIQAPIIVSKFSTTVSLVINVGEILVISMFCMSCFQLGMRKHLVFPITNIR